MSGFLLDVDQGIAQLNVNRPERLNALTSEMMDELGDICRRLERDDHVYAVILSGVGRAFCAGGDVDQWSNLSPDAFARHWVRDGHESLDRLARLRQPVIAVLNGHALGGGLELAACADYRIAENHIKIGQPETGLGIIAGWSGTQRATRRFGAQLVRRMALFGEVFSADDALKLGIVDQVVKAGEGQGAALEFAKRLKQRAPIATELTKMLINSADGEESERVVDALASRIVAAHPELQKGIDAFRDRSSPDYWSDYNSSEKDK